MRVIWLSVPPEEFQELFLSTYCCIRGICYIYTALFRFPALLPVFYIYGIHPMRVKMCKIALIIRHIFYGALFGIAFAVILKPSLVGAFISSLINDFPLS